MALQPQLTLNRLSCNIGQSPPPMLALQVYNPNASAVVVTGVQLSFWDTVGNQLRQAPVAASMFPTGPGVPTSVPAGQTISLGPIPVAVFGAQNGNPQQMVPVGALPPNMQGAMPIVLNLVIGATVYGSDGSANEAGRVQLIVAPQSQPFPLTQGGVAVMFDQDNSGLVAAFVG